MLTTVKTKAFLILVAVGLLLGCSGPTKEVNKQQLTDSLANNRSKLPPPANMNEDIADHLCGCFTPLIKFSIENQDLFSKLDSGGLGLADASRVMAIQGKIMMLAQNTGTCIDSVGNDFGVDLADSTNLVPVMKSMETRCPEIRDQLNNMGMGDVSF